MIKIARAITGILCLALICLTAGCGGSAPKNVQDSFTLEDLERRNNIDAVFGKYQSIRVEAIFYDFDLSDRNDGDFTQSSVFVKGNYGVSVYTEFSFGEMYAVENRNVYHKYADGTYGLAAFFDDGLYEEYYLPIITQWIAYTPTDGEEIISVSAESSIRKVVTNARASAAEGFDDWGIPDGIVESNYELDEKSGLLLREADYLITDDGSRRILSETQIHYGKDDSYNSPEYVALCKDMTEARTVRFVRLANTADEKVFTFTVPKGIILRPAAMEEYEYYEDAECTILYDLNTDDYLDGLTLYMKQLED